LSRTQHAPKKKKKKKIKMTERENDQNDRKKKAETEKNKKKTCLIRIWGLGVLDAGLGWHGSGVPKPCIRPIV